MTFQNVGTKEMPAIGSGVGTVRFTQGGIAVVRTFRAQSCQVRQVCG